ncbi:terminal uridylyltransferase 7 [Paramormyrops kingsleyae]|uniref:terminal uridylyltransferase 7 n=1 Tax=Paramormyrops kingsleyae TaxID=1676925 RepID=UPI003B97CDEB
MENTGKKRKSKQSKERSNVSEDPESWRSPIRFEDLEYSRNYNRKPEKGFHDKKGMAIIIGNSPRSRGYSPSNSSPREFGRGGYRNRYEHREGFRKFPILETPHLQEKNWREHPSGGSWRKNAFQEDGEDLGRPLEAGNRQRHLKDLINWDPDSHASGHKRRMRQRRKDHSERDEDGGAHVTDISALSEKERRVEERIGKEGIFRLRNRSRNNPKARYHCNLCDALLESLSVALKHLKERFHKKRSRDRLEEMLLIEIPPPEEAQTQAVGITIEKQVVEYGLDDKDVEMRHRIVFSMEEAIRADLPECSLRLYGSSCTKFGFKDSDVNIDIQFPPHMHQPDVLLLVNEALSKSSVYMDLEADFHARVPVVVCKEKQSGLICKVSAGNDNAYLTTEYLSALANLEPHLRPLVVGFRRWAQICHIDHPEEGGLPPYVLALMVIFFLQQRKEPLLPNYLGSWIVGFSMSRLNHFHLTGVENDHVLWEFKPSQEETAPSVEICRNGKVPLVFEDDRWRSVTLGQLWVEMLRFYSLEFDMANRVISVRLNCVCFRESKDWSKKRIAVEDPFAVKRNVARTVNSQVMYEYILHCLKTTYKYFAMPLGQQKSHLIDQKAGRKRRDCHSSGERNQDDERSYDESDPCAVDPLLPADGFLLESGLKTLSLRSPMVNGQTDSEDVASDLRVVVEGERASFLEDSDYVEEGVVCADSAESDCERVEEDCPLDMDESDDMDPTNLPHFPQEQEPETESPSDLEAPVEIGDSDDPEGLDREDEDSGSADDILADLKKPSCQANQSDEDDEEEEEEEYTCQHLDSFTTEEEQYPSDMVSGEELLSEGEGLHTDRLVQEGDGPGMVVEPSSHAVDLTKTLECPGRNLQYKFHKMVFTRGKSHTIVCSLCKHDGHLKRDCPEDFKRVELDPLPPMTPKFLRILNDVCIQCYRDFSPDEVEEKVREHILQDLEKFIRLQFEGAKLRLFGSSKNGFGFKQSDLDICMVLEGHETSEGLDCIAIIESLARVLRKLPGLRNILPITTAKVPIVKFFHEKTGLEGDLSLYNTLALHNTRLLASYAAIDPRVKYLCYAMKVFSKVCDIGDASRGSLSSYAYTLMVLFFLQQRSPPVIPVLQEIYDGPKKPEILVDGWNVYFFDKLDELPRRWPEYHSNTESVGELWLGLLQFYTEEFDFKEHVISIRREQLLTTFKKQWTSKYIVIEDPFDLNHNLGAGLSRRMTNFIMKAFINGRRVFGTPIKVYPPEYPSKMEYFFDPEVLTEGELAPNDRCCRICGKIGHFMKDCPIRRKVRQKRDPLNYEDGGGGRRHHGNQDRVRPEPLEVRDQALRHGDRRKGQEEKRCFICGSCSHIMKECPKYRGRAGSPRGEGLSTSGLTKSPRERQGSPLREERRMPKQSKMTLSPRAGSLTNRHLTQGRASSRRKPMD